MRRDEVSRLEAAVRDANPVPNADDLIDSDDATAVTLLVEQRRRTMTATPTQTTPQPTGPPPRRRPSMAWAFAASFVVILLLVGGAAWLLPSDEGPVADEPATPTTVTTPEVATTAVDEPASTPPADPETPVVADGWQKVATLTEEPWVEGIHQIEPLPGGGYVTIGNGPEDRLFVMWSPNGVDWFDGDPQRLFEDVKSDFPSLPPQSLAAVGEHVAVLGDGPQDEIALSIGDPRTGTWERIPLDATGVEGDLRGVRLAANDEEMLVAAYAVPAPDAEAQGAASTQVIVWLVDAAQGTATRNSFPVSATLGEDEELLTPLVEWVEERWILIAIEDADGPEGDEQRNTLWTSPDGRSWSQVAMAEGMGGVHSLRAGSLGVAAAACGRAPGAYPSPIDGDGFWYSPDGLDWSLVSTLPHGNPVTASWGDRGFVVAISIDSGSGVQLIASDGSEMVVMPSPFNGAWAAAASGDTLLASPWRGVGLWLYQDPAGE